MKELDLGQNDIIPEDLISLSIDVRYKKEGIWHTIVGNRAFIQNILNIPIHRDAYIEELKVYEISFVTFEGEDCSIRYIKDYSTGIWRLE